MELKYTFKWIEPFSRHTTVTTRPAITVWWSYLLTVNKDQWFTGIAPPPLSQRETYLMFHCSSYTPAVACIYNWHRNTIVIRQTLSCKWKCRAERFLVYSDSIRCKVLLPLCSKWFGCSAVQRAVAVTVPFHNGSESRACSASADCYRVFRLIKRLNRTSDWIGFMRIQ